MSVKVAYHGGLGASLIPLVCVAFLGVILIDPDPHTFSLRAGVAAITLGVVVAVVGVVLNRKTRRRNYRPRSRFDAPHELGHVPVQYLGGVIAVGGIAMLIQYLI